MTVKTKAKAIAGLLRGQSERRWRLAEYFAEAIHKDAVLGEHGKLWRTDMNFISTVQTMDLNRQWERLWTLDQLAKFAGSQLQGDFVECGVAGGNSAFFLCRRALNKLVHLFDSWEGLSKPSELDDSDYWHEGDLNYSLGNAQRRLSPYTNARYYKGWIPTRFPDFPDVRVALLHIDTDLHDPARDTLEFFYQRLEPGALIICDDYGFTTCPGEKVAVDAFFADKEPVIELATGQALIIKT